MLDDVKLVEYVMLNGFKSRAYINSDFFDRLHLTICLHHEEKLLRQNSYLRPKVKEAISETDLPVLYISTTSNINMSGNENQPSLIGGHAEYVKGAAEVSLTVWASLFFLSVRTLEDLGNTSLSPTRALSARSNHCSTLPHPPDVTGLLGNSR